MRFYVRPIGLLLLSSFLPLCHVLPLFYMGCGALHNEESPQTPPYARLAYVIAGGEDCTRNGYDKISNRCLNPFLIRSFRGV